MDGVVAATVALVNACTPGYARTRPYAVPEGSELAATVTEAFTIAPPREPLDADELAELVRLASRLRQVFELVDRGDMDAAAHAVNELLTSSRAMPRLDRHDGEPWHLHFHAPDITYAAGWAAGCATGLAIVLGGEYADRLGVCSAEACDRVYVDTSRNGTKRFCSTACQNRMKTAAFRARR